MSDIKVMVLIYIAFATGYYLKWLKDELRKGGAQ